MEGSPAPDSTPNARTEGTRAHTPTHLLGQLLHQAVRILGDVVIEFVKLVGKHQLRARPGRDVAGRRLLQEGRGRAKGGGTGMGWGRDGACRSSAL